MTMARQNPLVLLRAFLLNIYLFIYLFFSNVTVVLIQEEFLQHVEARGITKRVVAT